MSLLLVVKEITSVRKFFGTRTSDSDPTALQQSFADSIIHKIGLMKDFGAMDAAKLNEALSDDPVGPQTARIKAHVEELVGTSLKKSMASASKDSKPEGPKSSQFLKYWNRYCTKSELTYLSDDSKSFNSKLTLLVERAMKVGCHSGEEQTKKWMLALLVRLHYKELPSAQSLYDKVQDLKRTCKAEWKNIYAEFIDEFPENAEELPQAIFGVAYADEAPHPVELSGLNAIAKGIPLRENSKLLKKGKPLQDRLDAEKALHDADRTEDHDFREQPVLKHEQPVVKQERVKLEPVVNDEPHSPISDDEEVIMLKLKLAKVRAKRERLSPSPSPSPAVTRASGSAVSVSRSEDGGFRLSAKPKLEPESPTEQDDVKPKAEVKDELSAGGAGETPKLEDLDAYTRAAIESLKARNAKKDEADKKASAAKKADAKKDEAENNAADTQKAEPMKRPASGMKRSAASINHESPKKKLSKPSVQRDKSAAVEPQSKVKPKMPLLPRDGSSPTPVKYWGGIIYTARASKKFRALKVKGNAYTEASASWGREKPTKAAWDKCLTAIHNHYSGK